jgi:hypothetical protein
MGDKGLKRREFFDKLLLKKRLIILNEETFEETFSFRLNIMSVFVLITFSSILLVGVTTVIIAFTPLREFIPGYSSTELKKNATELALKSDSLSLALKKNEAYIKSIQKVLTGDLEYAKFNKDSILAATNDDLPTESDLKVSQPELDLREQVQEEEKKVFSKK